MTKGTRVATAQVPTPLLTQNASNGMTTHNVIAKEQSDCGNLKKRKIGAINEKLLCLHFEQQEQQSALHRGD